MSDAILIFSFGGPEKRDLFVAARQGLYRLRTLTRGVARPAKVTPPQESSVSCASGAGGTPAPGAWRTRR